MQQTSIISIWYPARCRAVNMGVLNGETTPSSHDFGFVFSHVDKKKVVLESTHVYMYREGKQLKKLERLLTCIFFFKTCSAAYFHISFSLSLYSSTNVLEKNNLRSNSTH